LIKMMEWGQAGVNFWFPCIMFYLFDCLKSLELALCWLNITIFKYLFFWLLLLLIFPADCPSYMFDLSLPLSRIETTRNRVTRLILTPGQIYN
jgi:hypothetical protein